MNYTWKAYYIDGTSLCQFDDEIEYSGSADEPIAELSEISVDGAGNGTFQTLYTSSGDLENGSFTYTVGDDGSLTVFTDSETLRGIISQDGNVLTLALTTTDEPGIIVGIKKSTGMTNASLRGKYIISQFADEITYSGSADHPVAMLSEISLDGVGNGTYQDLYTSSGDLDTGSFTYAVADDGSLTIFSDGDVLHGIISSDGSVFALSFTTGDEPGFMVGIRKSTVSNPAIPLLLLGD